MTNPSSGLSSDDKDGIRNDEDARPTESLFRIMDGIIAELNTTKKMFILMILSVMILPPIALIVSFSIADAVTEGHPWFFLHRDPWIYAIIRNLPLLISLAWLGIGIRQWFILSSWAKRYERYKLRQRELDRQLGDVTDDEEI
jgi:hypothetical protein